MRYSFNSLYFILIAACLAGYTWLYYSFSNGFASANHVEVCIVKHVTDMPCPSCGSTRSLISVIKGDFLAALLINPIGYLIAFLMLLIPLWIAFDFLSKRESLLYAYRKFENIIRKPQLAIPLILLIIINWIWNINKGL